MIAIHNQSKEKFFVIRRGDIISRFITIDESKSFMANNEEFMFIPSLTLQHVKWCAEECRRQSSGELSVANMVEALLYLFELQEASSIITIIQTVAELVEPQKNQHGFRHMPVTVGEKIISVYNFTRVLANLCEAVTTQQITAEEWYQEFEELHPFNDGNGRVGALMYNVFNGTLENPLVPPEFKKT